ncbi:2'-5' RNA ligase family protein [Pseudonocardia sp. GCM10023141]|uniref:2'-5' RNA ligase family protein n=1 Tax=Pseudonocardia sp. GCM10023141 TaxID=3252653 RepID=UPI00361AAEAE
MTRLSVAVHLPADVRAAVAALPREPVPGIIWSLPAQWIVKVRPLGHVAERLVAALVEALAAELAGAPAVTCVLGPVTERRSGQWLAAPVAGLDELAEAVFDATAGLVPVTHPQPFRADLVLARGRVPKEVGGAPLAASWTATAVVLVADRSAPGRPRLDDLAAFPLRE